MGEGDNENKVPFTLAMVAGGVAGTTVDVVMYPLDTLKTRLQAEGGFLKAGGFKGVYNGVTATALGAAPGASMFFSAYEGMKPRLQALNGGEEHPIHHSLAASFGEVAACLVRVPTAVVTQNMQVGTYSSYPEAIQGILAKNGISSFFMGYWTTVAREIPFSFIQFPMYEGLKSAWRKAQGEDTSAVQGAACGSLSGGVASAVTTPLDVVKTRMMLGNKTKAGKLYVGTVNSLVTIFKEEGAAALMSGVGPRVGWISIGGFVFFGAYEKAMELCWQTGAWGAKKDFRC